MIPNFRMDQKLGVHTEVQTHEMSCWEKPACSTIGKVEKRKKIVHLYKGI